MQFFTIGVYNSTEAEFFSKLTENNIDTFCDIRQRRGVRGAKYAFVNSKRLQYKLGQLGIYYLHLTELAPTAEIRELQKNADKENGELKRKAANLIGNIENLGQYILDHGLVDWNGSIENAFDGLLSWTSAGSGFIPYGGQYPSKSTGFWVSDIDLYRSQYGENIKYRYPVASIFRQAKFVGYQNQLAIIPAGTIVRLSLSRRFSSFGNDGFWLQISGWY